MVKEPRFANTYATTVESLVFLRRHYPHESVFPNLQALEIQCYSVSLPVDFLMEAPLRKVEIFGLGVKDLPALRVLKVRRPPLHTLAIHEHSHRLDAQ